MKRLHWKAAADSAMNSTRASSAAGFALDTRHIRRRHALNWATILDRVHGNCEVVHIDGSAGGLVLPEITESDMKTG